MNSLVCLSLLALVAGVCAQGFKANGGVPNNAPSLPGAGGMKDKAKGEMQAMVKMMMKGIDKKAVNKLIQQAAEILQNAFRSGLKYLDAKRQKTSGRKDQGGLDDDAKQVIEAYLKAMAGIIHHSIRS